MNLEKLDKARNLVSKIREADAKLNALTKDVGLNFDGFTIDDVELVEKTKNEYRERLLLRKQLLQEEFDAL